MVIDRWLDGNLCLWASPDKPGILAQRWHDCEYIGPIKCHLWEYIGPIFLVYRAINIQARHHNLLGIGKFCSFQSCDHQIGPCRFVAQRHYRNHRFAVQGISMQDCRECHRTSNNFRSLGPVANQYNILTEFLEHKRAVNYSIITYLLKASNIIM